MLYLALAAVAAFEIATRCGILRSYHRVAMLLRRMPGVISARPQRDVWKERAVGGLSVRLWVALGRSSLLLLVVLMPIVAVGLLDRNARSLLLDIPTQILMLCLVALYAFLTRPFRKQLRLWRAPAA